MREVVGDDREARVRGAVGRLLEAGVSGHVFPGATCAVCWRGADGGPRAVTAWAGHRAPGAARVGAATLYDLGAITRAVVAVAALRAEAEGALDLGREVEAALPAARGGVLGGVTLRELLDDRGGLAASGGLYLDVPHAPGSSAARRWLLSEAARREGERRSPGATGPRPPERSDLGFLVAGEALSRVLRKPLAEVVRGRVAAPLEVEDDLLYPAALPGDQRAAVVARCAPSERCAWRGRPLRGEVNEENAFAFGGVAGHAGLFGTAGAVAAFGYALAGSAAGSGWLPPDALASIADAGREGDERLGFFAARDQPAVCGRRASAASFGQVGLPGASLLVDPAAGAAIALLTNRAFPSRANLRIDGFRPAFHDSVLAALA